MNKTFCHECNKEVEYKIIQETIKEYKGYKVDIVQNIAICNNCNEKIYISEVDMKRNFALWLKSNFSENIKYPFSGKFREVTSVEELRILMQQYADEKTYSINDPKEEKINILKSEDGQYSIFFLDKNGKKYILEKETENPFVFKRFYNEVTYYGETMRQIREYEEVFEDKLEDDVKIQLLGY